MDTKPEKQKGEAKTARIPIKIVPRETLKKPAWIRVKAGDSAGRFGEIKQTCACSFSAQEFLCGLCWR